MEEVTGSSPLSSTHYFLWSGAKRIGVISALCAAALVVSILPLGAPACSATWRKGTPNVGCIERGAKLASVRSKCNNAFVREFKGAPRQSRLGVTAFSHRSP